MKATHGLNGAHTAGIFADMTVDGPEIGTLVVIVDRAKNLPNRKTIGKQDPYCAARLGKEAKKTETDRRGGQTPRWDQELRFTVHDSSDYYQLKVSVFNDDKRTDLIGETWVSLQEVVIPGGGQNDIWHTLSCKGKYAGEIRIEITYYDTRPKSERPEKTKQSLALSTEEAGRDSLKGPRQPKAAVKRRPLPSDPVTGAPPPPSAIPDHVQTPPRGYKSPVGTPDHSQTPPRGYDQSLNGQDYSSTPPRAAMQEHVPTPPRGPPLAIPPHIQSSTRGHQNPSHISHQSPLQNLEYGTPTSIYSAGDFGNSPMSNAYSPAPNGNPIPYGGHEIYEANANNDYTQGHGSYRSQYDDEPEVFDSHNTYNRHTPYELPQPDEFGSPPSPGGPPPPPPAHRSRHGSNQVSPQPAPAVRSQESYGFPPARSNTYDSNPAPEVHRNSISNYSQPKPYMAYVTPKKEDQYRKNSTGAYQDSEPRHQSFDSRYNAGYNSMQPTVEDAPPSPSGRYSGQRGSVSQSPGYQDNRYDKVPSPAPLNFGSRGSVASGRNSTSNTPTHHPSHQYSGSVGYSSSNSQVSSMRDRSQTGTSLTSRTSHNTLAYQQNQIVRKPSYSQLSDVEPDYGLPPVPATLVAGMDPSIAQDISDRIYDERRKSFSSQPPPPQPSYGSYQGSSQYHQPSQSQQYQQSYQNDTYASSVAPSTSYDEMQSRYSSSVAPAQKPRGLSPDPRVPARKSVSPSPEPSSEQRRLSGIPFGPDSYNALNPTISSSTSTPSLSARYDIKEPDKHEKIITHDGREIDPSDHIPESNYAPLLESKGPKYASQQPDRNYRAPPSGSQPNSGRRQLKVAARPVSMATPSGPAVYMGTGPNDPLAQQSGRNRLQKKSNRMPAMPGPNSSPLAPISPYQSNNHTPRSVPRPNTGGYDANENYSPTPNYGGGYRGHAGPPIPAKVPVRMDSGPPQQPGGDAWAILEEMKNIDLGSGRARRRGY